jgi:hypothetical protein
MYTRETRVCSFDLIVPTRKKAIKQQQQQRDTVASFGFAAAVFTGDGAIYIHCICAVCM